MKQFYNVELQPKQAELLKDYLRKENIYFEPSACYNLIHFEIKASEKEVKKVNRFLNNL